MATSCFSCFFMSKKTAELPDDLIYSIFLLLPIKTLVRFRSLSKQWNQIICSRKFSLDRPLVSNIIQSFVSEKKMKPRLFIHKNWADEFHRSQMKSYLPPIPSELMPRWIIAEATCDGLICGICINGKRNKTYNATVYIIIWNPHTRQHRVVPTPEGFRYNHCRPDHFRLGYDPSISDYKIVYLKRDGRAIQVFSLKSNTWRTVNDASTVDLLGGNYINHKDSVFVRGNVYCLWQVKHSNTDVIVKFSLKEEKLTAISLPPKLKNRSNRNDGIIKLGQYHDGSLCLFCYWFFVAKTERLVETWLHQEDVVGDRTWKKVASIPGASIPDKLTKDIMRPLGYTHSGDLILTSSTYLYGVYAHVPRASIVKKLKFEKRLKRKVLVDQHVQILDMETLISP
ncbi:unnamed protein product [Rhodiola kirilowii]